MTKLFLVGKRSIYVLSEDVNDVHGDRYSQSTFELVSLKDDRVTAEQRTELNDAYQFDNSCKKLIQRWSRDESDPTYSKCGYEKAVNGGYILYRLYTSQSDTRSYSPIHFQSIEERHDSGKVLLTLIGIDAQYRENALVDWVFNRTNGSWSMQVVNSYNDRLSFSKIPKARIPYQLRYLQETKYFGQNRASCGTAHKIWQRIPLPIFLMELASLLAILMVSCFYAFDKIRLAGIAAIMWVAKSYDNLNQQAMTVAESQENGFINITVPTPTVAVTKIDDFLHNISIYAGLSGVNQTVDCTANNKSIGFVCEQQHCGVLVVDASDIQCSGTDDITKQPYIFQLPSFTTSSLWSIGIVGVGLVCVFLLNNVLIPSAKKYAFCNSATTRLLNMRSMFGLVLLVLGYSLFMMSLFNLPEIPSHILVQMMNNAIKNNTLRNYTGEEFLQLEKDQAYVQNHLWSVESVAASAFLLFAIIFRALHLTGRDTFWFAHFCFQTLIYSLAGVGANMQLNGVWWAMSGDRVIAVTLELMLMVLGVGLNQDIKISEGLEGLKQGLIQNETLKGLGNEVLLQCKPSGSVVIIFKDNQQRQERVIEDQYLLPAADGDLESGLSTPHGIF